MLTKVRRFSRIAAPLLGIHRSFTWTKTGGALPFIVCLALGAVRVSAQSRTQDHLEQVYRQRQAVRYQYGGCSETFMDCSCFVQRVFKDAFGLRLPRSTFKQAQSFEKERLPGLRSMDQLRPSSLCPGDLIYTYRKGSWPTSSRHVAIYFGEGKILHSARKLGVAKQPLSVLNHHRLHGVVRLFECSEPAEPDPVDSADRCP